MAEKKTKTSKAKKTAKSSSKSASSVAKKSGANKAVVKDKKEEDLPVILADVQSKKVLNIILLVIIAMLILIFFNLFSLLKTRQELKHYIKVADEVELLKEDIKVEKEEVVDKGRWVGVGDNFSSFAYIDKDKTDMVLDDYVTSFVFPPIYSFEKKADLVILDTNDEARLEESFPAEEAWVLTGNKNSCLNILEEDCLEIVDANKVFYNGRQIDFPREMQTEKVLKIDSSFLESKFVLSFVVAEEEQERAYAYFFDGRRYTVLVGKDSEEKIITKYSRPGGVMVAGGSDENFILLYNGYEAQAYHYLNGELTNISKFFGLRVSDGGFYPYIIKQGSGADSLWYILSLDRNKLKLIKLWQNGTEEIQGAYDFSYSFKGFSGLDLLAFRAIPESRGEIEFAFNTNLNFQSLNPKEPGIWLFKDGGFDNSQSRKVYSLNLNKNASYLNSAFFENMFFSSGYGDEQQGEVSLYFIDDNNNRLPTEIGKKIDFREGNRDAYWQLIFEAANSNEYSPWFDHVNSLYFFVQGN